MENCKSCLFRELNENDPPCCNCSVINSSDNTAQCNYKKRLVFNHNSNDEKIIRSKDYEKKTNDLYKKGYEDGMLFAIKNGYAFGVSNEQKIDTKQVIEDILEMLLIIHDENKTIMTCLLPLDQDTSKILDTYDKAIRESTTIYKYVGRLADWYYSNQDNEAK